MNENMKGGYNVRLNTKVIALILVLVLALGGVFGGTVAWLIANSASVVNTFTYGDINIELNETDTDLDDDDNPNTNDYEMIPGQKIEKDPTIVVKAGSETNWLFVKLEKSANFDTFMNYEMADGWTLLDGTQNVYFRSLTNENDLAADLEFEVIKDNTVTVKGEVTKEMLNALDSQNGTASYPTLTVSAYAVQYLGFEPEISDGVAESTREQIQAAAYAAWTKVLDAENTTQP